MLTPERELLREGLDLVPRIDDDDPMAGALLDWCRRVKTVLDNPTCKRGGPDDHGDECRYHVGDLAQRAEPC